MGLVASRVDDDDLLRPEEFEELEALSGFTRDEIRKLYRRFRTLDRSGDGTLGEEDLLRVPEVAMNPMVDRVVGYFGFGPHAIRLSGKSTTRVNFTDFVRALSLFNARSSKEEKLEHAFSTFDLDSDGILSRDEFTSLLRTLVGKSMEQADLEALVDYALMELNSENGLEFKDFLAVLQNSSDIDKIMVSRARTESSLEAFHRKRERELKRL
jgi:Ca2+-binding EF-hand superfamily protein